MFAAPGLPSSREDRLPAPRTVSPARRSWRVTSTLTDPWPGDDTIVVIDVNLAGLRLGPHHLTPDEQSRAERYRDPGARATFVATRAALRLLLARALDLTPRAVRLDRGPHGKLHMPDHPDLHLSVAHAENRALVALAWRYELGVDLERERDLPHLNLIPRVAFHPHERAELLGAPVHAARASFFRTWTRREAVLKALGTGFGTPVPGVRVRTSDAPRDWLELDPSAATVEIAAAVDLQVGAGWRGALVALGHGRPTVRQASFDEVVPP